MHNNAVGNSTERGCHRSVTLKMWAIVRRDHDLEKHALGPDPQGRKLVFRKDHVPSQSWSDNRFNPKRFHSGADL
jgi:hypothetical protein